MQTQRDSSSDDTVIIVGAVLICLILGVIASVMV
jgi:hypothetical protein